MGFAGDGTGEGVGVGPGETEVEGEGARSAGQDAGRAWTGRCDAQINTANTISRQDLDIIKAELLACVDAKGEE